MTSKPKYDMPRHQIKISKLILTESVDGHDALEHVLQCMNDRVVDSQLYEFNDYWHNFLNNHLNDANKKALENFLGVHIAEMDASYYDELPLKSKRFFTEWAEEMGAIRIALHEDPNSVPSWYYFDKKSEVIPNQWIIHFTDHINSIKQQGFIYGAPNANHLAVTLETGIYGNLISNADEPGYNFGYTLDEDIDHRANIAAKGKFYGSGAVLFRASCIKVFHQKDNENQAIFWGPDVKPVNIIPLSHSVEGWCAPMIEGGFKSLKALTTKIISGSRQSQGDDHGETK
jgi:hypothetical protein